MRVDFKLLKLQITKHLRLRYASPKLPSCLRADTHRQAATSFICKTLGETIAPIYENISE
jgi:hypothetical protein